MPISWGRLSAEAGPDCVRVHYDITFLEVVVFATFGAGFLAVMLCLPASDLGAMRYVFPIVAWAWLVGGNIALALGRFPAFIRKQGRGRHTRSVT
ncbi:hypothetical protein C1280_16420 [Gemmata obscuriglobus]|uniref:Uncharacterized protein n=1 Tax=Gemmata obscuriglobus TaxID=114 RepID=A0A2Z3GYB0_9BACT|nr:hypothetical protein C1280_16420 [Gemmata obscuriglobus]